MKELAKTARISLPAEVRKYVLERDRHQCQSCGSQDRLEVDHIIALARGGTNDISNLQTLCRSCNQHKKHHVDPRFQRHYSG